MITKTQIIDDINQLVSIIKQNRKSIHSYLPVYNRDILYLKECFYTIADNLTSEFTEQELYTIENDFVFYYRTLKEIIDNINNLSQSGNPAKDIGPTPLVHYSPFPSTHRIYASVIKQDDIDKFTIYIKLRIEGIKEEIEKKQKLQLQKIAKMCQLHNGLSDNLTQDMLAIDETLYDRQTQRHDAMIKNIINDLDGV